jgi:ABC-type transport system involved in Fe-S cluster assembly fused permease/ATPase subunit
MMEVDPNVARHLGWHTWHLLQDLRALGIVPVYAVVVTAMLYTRGKVRVLRWRREYRLRYNKEGGE